MALSPHSLNLFAGLRASLAAFGAARHYVLKATGSHDQMLDTSRTLYPNSFAYNGFIGPVRLVEKDQAHFLARHLLMTRRKTKSWVKALAVNDPLIFELATQPKLLDILRGLIGEDIVLWGGTLITREPGVIHPWHCDIESWEPAGGFASVWIGLLNTRRESSLRFVRGSHHYGVSLQELAAREQVTRAARSDELVLKWANGRSPDAEIVQPEASDGEALIFDGRIWHGSINATEDAPRVSLLLQYAKADVPLRIPDFGTLEWPFRFKDERPPVIAVTGRTNAAADQIVPAPLSRVEPEIQPGSYRISPALRCPEGVSFTPIRCFEGRTANADYAECHYSVLMPEASPHLPHAHTEEQILVVMSGAAELIITKLPDDPDPKIIQAPTGTALFLSRLPASNDPQREL